MWPYIRSFWVTAVVFVIGSGHALGQSGPLVGAAAFGDWRSDKPGLSRIIKPEDLPKPGATPSVDNSHHVVPRPPTAIPQVPPGFKVELFAEGLNGPREMRVAPNGDLFVAETGAGRIRVLRAADGDSKSVNEIFASGLNQPFGIAFSQVETILSGFTSPIPTASLVFLMRSAIPKPPENLRSSLPGYRVEEVTRRET